MMMRIFQVILCMCAVAVITVEAQKRKKSKNKETDEAARDKQSSFDKKLLKRYDKSEVPRKDQPTEVAISMYIIDLDLDEQKGTMTLTGYVRQKWNDPRLASGKGDTAIRLPDGTWDKIWIPDMFHKNARSVHVDAVPIPHRFLSLKPDGGLWYAYKATMVSPSNDLRRNGPAWQNASCPIIFESFGYTMDDVYFSWMSSPPPIEKDPELYLDNFTLQDQILSDCSKNYTTDTRRGDRRGFREAEGSSIAQLQDVLGSRRQDDTAFTRPVCNNNLICLGVRSFDQ